MASINIQNDLILLSGAFLFVLGVIGLSMLLKKKGVITGHTARKIVHLLCGFSVFIVPYLTIPFLALIISLIFLAVTRFSHQDNFGKQVFDMMAEKDERVVGYLSGPFSYALSVNILVFIFAFDTRFFYFPASSIMVMAISDTIASYVGKKWGKHHIDLKYTKTVRTIEGSLGLLISAFILSMFGFLFFGSWFPNNSHTMTLPWIITLSLLMAFTSTIIELLSPSNLDDLTVPITGCLITFGLTVLLFPASIGL
jgi:phytol kinase